MKMSMIGHNGGPELTGTSWRKHCWQAARARLLPVLPIEVVRTRVRRAKDLGLDYKTYAGVRATTGHDLVAFLFSSNALRVTPSGQIPEPETVKLLQILGADRIALGQEISPDLLLARNVDVLNAAFAAPKPYAAFRDQVAAIREALGRVPGDRVLLVADAPWEAEWAAAGRLAGVLPAARYFA
jgi:hypothetical protein